MTVTTFEVEVGAFRRVGTKKWLYDGKIYCADAEFPFCESSDKAESPGFFTKLEDIAEAITATVREQTSQMDYLDRDLTSINFYSPERPTDDVPSGFIQAYGAYMQRKLTSGEMEQLIKLTDAQLRPRFYVPKSK